MKQKLLEWEETKGTKMSWGNKHIFAYQKSKKNYILIIEAMGGMAVRHLCKTEQDCIIISNILNKV